MEICQVCGNDVDDFDICTHEFRPKSSLGSKLIGPFVSQSDLIDFDDTAPSMKSVKPIIFGPFAALLLDAILPTWSTLWITLGLLLLATVLTNAIWSQIGMGQTFSLTSFLKSIPRVILTPSLIRIFSSKSAYRPQVTTWIASLVMSGLAVLWIGMPGNGKGLEMALQSGIKAKTGQTLNVECPTLFNTFPGSTTTCYTKVILGLKIPVKVKVKNFLGEVSWTASLN